MKRLLFALVLLAGFLCVRDRADAVCAGVPNTFTNGTTADANQVNANFSALVACLQNIDNTQIGAAGIFASQILPTSLAQATFGGAFNYSFPTAVNVAVTSLGTIGGGSQVSQNGAVFGGNVESANGVFTAPSGTLIQLCPNNACNAFVSLGGAFEGKHNACSSSSGLPCAIQTTCTLSGGTCQMTAPVPSGSVCSVSALFEGGATPQGISSSVATTTLTINVSYSGGTSGGANATCD